MEAQIGNNMVKSIWQHDNKKEATWVAAGESLLIGVPIKMHHQSGRIC